MGLKPPGRRLIQDKNTKNFLASGKFFLNNNLIMDKDDKAGRGRGLLNSNFRFVALGLMGSASLFQCQSTPHSSDYFYNENRRNSRQDSPTMEISKYISHIILERLHMGLREAGSSPGLIKFGQFE